MTNLDRLLKIIEFDGNHTFKYTETEHLIELEIEENVFRTYTMKGEDVDTVKEKLFWYIIENFISYYKPIRLKDEFRADS